MNMTFALIVAVVSGLIFFAVGLKISDRRWHNLIKIRTEEERKRGVELLRQSALNIIGKMVRSLPTANLALDSSGRLYDVNLPGFSFDEKGFYAPDGTLTSIIPSVKEEWEAFIKKAWETYKLAEAEKAKDYTVN